MSGSASGNGLAGGSTGTAWVGASPIPGEGGRRDQSTTTKIATAARPSKAHSSAGVPRLGPGPSSLT